MELQNQIDTYWEERAESYSAQNKGQLKDTHAVEWARLILENAPRQERLKILDIGTGPGFFAVLLAKMGHEVTAVDRSGEMLRQAKENAENNGVTVEFYQVGEELPFREASFDLVLSRDVTWMQLHPEDVLSRWFDLVRPGGRMLYFDANWYGYLRTKDTFRQYQAHRKYVRSSHGFIYEKAREMERMALEFPLTYQVRPAWDEKFWKTKDVSRVYSMTELNSRIYSQMEQIQYAKTPEFLVVVEK